MYLFTPLKSITCSLALATLFFSSSSLLYCETPMSALLDSKEINAEDTLLISFTPPTGWRAADTKALPKSVKMMVIGSGKHTFPPSINVGIEPYKGTLKQYLETIKSINSSQGASFQELGTLRTKAGLGSLSQVQAKTEWGNVRLMHVILKKDDFIIVATAAAKKEEFAELYNVFFNSLKSLQCERKDPQSVE